MFAPLVRIPNFREYVDNWRIFRLLCTQRVLYVKYAYILCKQSRIHGLTRIAMLWLTGACVWVRLCACASPTNRALGPENFTNSAACLPAACWLLDVGCWSLICAMLQRLWQVSDRQPPGRFTDRRGTTHELTQKAGSSRCSTHDSHNNLPENVF